MWSYFTIDLSKSQRLLDNQKKNLFPTAIILPFLLHITLLFIHVDSGLLTLDILPVWQGCPHWRPLALPMSTVWKALILYWFNLFCCSKKCHQNLCLHIRCPKQVTWPNLKVGDQIILTGRPHRRIFVSNCKNAI
jgi:hypothetical protein